MTCASRGAPARPTARVRAEYVPVLRRGRLPRGEWVQRLEEPSIEAWIESVLGEIAREPGMAPLVSRREERLRAVT